MFVVLLCWSSGSFAWWNDTWPYRMPINIDASAAGANLQESHENVTVLVKLHPGNFEDFFLVQENLADLRFIDADDKTLLKHHVEKIDLANQLIYVWVKIPKLTGQINTERVWMYYGNQEATDAAETAASYDDNTALVYHFDEKLTDSSAYQTSPEYSEAESIAASVIASGLKFSGQQRTVIPGLSSMSTSTQGATVSLWMRNNGDQAQEGVLLEQTYPTGTIALLVQGNTLFVRLTAQGATLAESPKVPVLTPDNWHHIALVLTSEIASLYVDGKYLNSIDAAILPLSGQWSIGGALLGDAFWSGEVDELRIDSVPRSEDWIKLLVASQGMQSNLLHAQPAEQLGSGGETGYFMVLFASVDEVGWAVIGLLGVMAVISWAVMIGKFIYISQVTRDNGRFLHEYRELGGRNPGLLDHEDSEEDKAFENTPIAQAIFGSHDHFQSSPIYRLYHRGIQEVHSRLGKSAAAQVSHLTQPAVQAIRSALDAQLVREIQRLNSKMVLLTIAVSGGPFLGLMGTVIGVMITFAVIAATGDVNISAIAPGVAAALLATVAGLVVAIPALFGYNWLATRAKENVADMRVFVDEFVTRLAEYYGE